MGCLHLTTSVDLKHKNSQCDSEGVLYFFFPKLKKWGIELYNP